MPPFKACTLATPQIIYKFSKLQLFREILQPLAPKNIHKIYTGYNRYKLHLFPILLYTSRPN